MLRIVRPIFRRKDLRPEIALMKDRALAKAHLYAWQYYRASGFRLRARWHDLCERACSAPNGWRRWAAFLKGIAAGPRP